MSSTEKYNYSIGQLQLGFWANSSASFKDQSDLIHEVLTKFIRPPILCFGIIGNILNLIILLRQKSRRTQSTIAFLTAMSLMDLIVLCFQSVFTLLEFLKTLSLQLATIDAYYRCYIRYYHNFQGFSYCYS